MSTSLHTRLSLSFLVVLIFGMATAALVAWRSVEGLYLDTQRENLLAQASLTAAALQGQALPAGPEEPYLQTANVQPGIHTRLLTEQGAVLVGLPLAGETVQLPAAENTAAITPANLLQRPEIQAALQGQAATAIRRVASAGNRRVLYAAAPVMGADGMVSGLVYLATPLPPAGLPSQWLVALAGAALGAIAVAGVVSTWLARRLARPVETIAQAASEVSRGDLTQQVQPEVGIQELHHLGTAFNRMTESLRQSEQAKSAFVADVTHELRTPLTVIKGTLETLEDGALEDTEGRGALLTAMQRETDRLIRLVNDLLVLARADAGTLNLRREPVDLAALARSRCEYLASLAAGKQVELCVQEAESTPARYGRGDPDRLAQVLDNLLDNAIRYSPEGGIVTVEVTKQGDNIACTVRDQGPGIPPEHLPLIFERFYRADASRNRHTGGAGLGLAIVRALLAAQGGNITVESQPGQGAAFHFFLLAVAAPVNAD